MFDGALVLGSIFLRIALAKWHKFVSGSVTGHLGVSRSRQRGTKNPHIRGLKMVAIGGLEPPMLRLVCGLEAVEKFREPLRPLGLRAENPPAAVQLRQGVGMRRADALPLRDDALALGAEVFLQPILDDRLKRVGHGLVPLAEIYVFQRLPQQLLQGARRSFRTV